MCVLIEGRGGLPDSPLPGRLRSGGGPARQEHCPDHRGQEAAAKPLQDAARWRAIQSGVGGVTTRAAKKQQRQQRCSEKNSIQNNEDGSCVMERIEPGEHHTTLWAADPTPGEYAAAASEAMLGPAWLRPGSEPLIEG